MNLSCYDMTIQNYIEKSFYDMFWKTGQTWYACNSDFYLPRSDQTNNNNYITFKSLLLCILTSERMLAHAFACVRMVENDQKHFFFFLRKPLMCLLCASHAHDEKGTFLLIFECFWSFSTMRSLVKIHNTLFTHFWN